MTDPVIPRYPAGASGQPASEPAPADLTRGMDVFFRGLALSVLVIVLLCGVYYGLEVFGRIGAILKDPKQVEAAVVSTTQLIDGDKLKVEYQPDKTLEPGRAIALVLLGVGYLVWAMIPIQIVATTGRVLLSLTKKT